MKFLSIIMRTIDEVDKSIITRGVGGLAGLRVFTFLGGYFGLINVIWCDVMND